MLESHFLMEIKSDEISLRMVVPEAEEIPELAALPAAGRPTRGAPGCCGDHTKPSWVTVALQSTDSPPQLLIPLGCDIMPSRPLFLSPPGPGRFCWHRGALLTMAAAGMGSSVQPVAGIHVPDIAMLRYSTWATWPRLDNTHPSPSLSTLTAPEMGINPGVAIMDGLRSCKM